MNKTLDKKAVISGFNRAASSYDNSAILQQEISQRLLERLQWIKIQPKTILDLGCGTGIATAELQKIYPDARLYALDIAEQMLSVAKHKHSLQNPIQQNQSQQKSNFLQRISQKFSAKKHPKIHYIAADAEHLPFQNQQFDLVFSNLAVQWCENTQTLFNQLQRILTPNGCLLFSSFGVDTLIELKQSWHAVDESVHVNEFVDMHELGDAMLQSGLVDPVMDTEKITMQYSELKLLFKDLKQIGAQNHLQNRSKALMGKIKFQAMLKNYEQFKLSNGKYPASYEVVYGHGWGRDLNVGVQKSKSNSLAQPIHFIKNK